MGSRPAGNLNDCYECGGWMTSDDIQQRDWHGICNACLVKHSRALDESYDRHPEGDDMRVPNRDYPAEYDGDETLWVQRDGEWTQVQGDPVEFTNSLSIGTESYWQDLDGEWYPINDTSPEWVRNARNQLEGNR